MTDQPKDKGGRPRLPVRRSEYFAMRTYPDVAEKARRLGTERIEAMIRRARES